MKKRIPTFTAVCKEEIPCEGTHIRFDHCTPEQMMRFCGAFKKTEEFKKLSFLEQRHIDKFLKGWGEDEDVMRLMNQYAHTVTY